MLTKGLDWETEQLLAEILERENTTSDELIKNLIRDRWLSLNKQSLELPINLLEPMQAELNKQAANQAESNQVELNSAALNDVMQPQSRQRNSKQTIAEFIRRKRYR